MTPFDLDELERQAYRAGRGELVSVDMEKLLEVVKLAKRFMEQEDELASLQRQVDEQEQEISQLEEDLANGYCPECCN